MAESRIEELRIIPYEDYLRTPEWAERRANALQRAFYRCQICNSPHDLNVHHRTYENRGCEKPEDLTVLCNDCHKLYHYQDIVEFQISTITECLATVLDNYNKAIPDGIIGIPTSFWDLDRLMGGMQRGNLVVVGGRPTVGKTAFVTGIAARAATKHDQRCLIFSSEMTRSQLADRLLATLTGMGSDAIRRGKFPDDGSLLLHTVEQLSSAPIFIDDTAGVKPKQIWKRSLDLYTDQGLDLIIVDYLELLGDDEPSASQYQTVANKARSLKALAKELNVPLLLVTQLGAHVEKRMDKRPVLSDLSGSLDADADVVMFIYRDELYDEISEFFNVAEIIVGKNRNGQTGTVHLYFKKEVPQFLDAEIERRGST